MASKTRTIVPTFSFLIPTRGRPDQLERMLTSVRDLTDRLDDVEIVLCMDEDDDITRIALEERLDVSPYRIRQVLVPPGQTMGALNNACLAASTGRYLMAMNDDVVLRTPGWDSELRSAFDSFEDGVALLHVNDLLFQERLCTFPLVSRVFCDLYGSFCPDSYRRYRIDDHIYDIFNLLALIGYPRIQYFPKVVFEHFNFELGADGVRDASSYKPDEAIIAVDAETFEQLRWKRKETALRLAQHIEDGRTERLLSHGRDLLNGVSDTFSYRRPDFVRVRGGEERLSSDNTRVTVGVVSADIQCEHARRCLDSVKRYTRNYDLIVLDNNRGPGFNHSREMNRLIRAARTDHLVLLDDDVFVFEGWLDGLLAQMGPDTGLVTPVHLNKDEKVSYAGVAMLGDDTGRHAHIIDVPRQARPTPTICSAAMLLDLQKCAGIRPSEIFEKYFMDIDLGFRFWEAGYKAMLAPDVRVIHVGGATLEQGSPEANERQERDRLRFVREWIDSGRLRAIQEGVWQNYPYLKWHLQLQGEVGRLLKLVRDKDPASLSEVRQLVASLVPRIGPVEIFVWDVRSAVWEIVLRPPRPLSPEELAFFERAITELESGEVYKRQRVGVRPPALNSHSPTPTRPQIKVIEPDFSGYGIYLCDDEFIAIPPAEGPLSLERLERGFYSQVHRHTDFTALRTTIQSHARPSASPSSGAPRRRASDVQQARLIEAGFQGFRISRLGHRYYATPEPSGEFTLSRFQAGEYPEHFLGESLVEVKNQISAAAKKTTPEDSESILLLGHLPEEVTKRYLRSLPDNREVSILAGKQTVSAFAEPRIELLRDAAEKPSDRFSLDSISNELLAKLNAQNFDRVIVPHDPELSWRFDGIEDLAAAISNRVSVLYADGTTLDCENESLHRLRHNAAYLRSMFTLVPSIRGQKVLEVGCGDGLACRMLAGDRPAEVHGVDVLPTAGALYSHPRVRYSCMAGDGLDFPNDSFDLTYSIATFQHVSDPFAALREIKRVTRPGGHCYIQAGPLYHSPFGHHMFAYFREEPWIHLRMQPEEILAYCKEKEIDRLIERDMGIPAEEYISNMLSRDHVNGLRLEGYRLQDFRQDLDIEVLRYSENSESQELLTDSITKELAEFDERTLITRDFEIIFRVK